MAGKSDNKKQSTKNTKKTKTAKSKNRSAESTKATTAENKQAKIKEMQDQRQRDRRVIDEIWGVTILAIGIFLIVTTQLNSTGSFGQAIHDVLMGLFGIMAYVLPYYFIVLAFCLFFKKMQHINGRTAFFSMLIFLMLCMLNSFRFIDPEYLNYDLSSLFGYYLSGVSGEMGGAIGMELGSLVVKFIGKAGLLILSLAVIVISLLLIVNTPISKSIEKMRARHEERMLMREMEEEEAERAQKMIAQPGANVGQTDFLTAGPRRPLEIEPDEPRGIRILNPIRTSAKLPDRSSVAEKVAEKTGIAKFESFDRAAKQIHNTTEIPFDAIEAQRKKEDFMRVVAQTDFGDETAEPSGSMGLGLDGESERKNGFGLDGYLDSFSDVGSARAAEPVAVLTPEPTVVHTPAAKKEPEYAPISSHDMGFDSYQPERKSSGSVSLGLEPAPVEPVVSVAPVVPTAPVKPAVPKTASKNRMADSAAAALADTERAATSHIDDYADLAAAAAALNTKEVKKANTPTQKDNEEVLREIAENTVVKPEYHFPPMDLLKRPKGPQMKMSDSQLAQKAELLEKTLRNFHVDARVLNVTQGSSVTRYEVQPAIGVKVSSITKLADDIALNLRAKSIRLEAPIPGKAAVGIEVENEKPSPVLIRELIDSDEFKNAKSKITFVVGKDISGRNIVANLKDMPHLLIAGATGSGKSVCINAIITSLLYKASPDEVKMILIDPKVVELGNYNGIPHMLIPVVTDPKKAAAALNWAVNEMNQRYKKFAEEGVKEIDSYNELMRANQEPDKVMPKVVIVIDELADLMMAAPSQVEESICRLAQLARAAGMHLIVATQRPSVDIVTGLIKANIPSRMAFSVSSQFDSRTILDVGGAEKLLGKGDMLFSPVGSNKPMRIQGPWISDTETSTIINYVKKQGEVDYDQDVINTIETPEKSAGGNAHADDLTEDAIAFILKSKKASVSMLQRRFRIGYNRAASIIDEIEDRGIISPADGSKPRQVLYTEEEYYNAADLEGDENTPNG